MVFILKLKDTDTNNKAPETPAASTNSAGVFTQH